jgi:protein-S-isoprenylcysteine O-methyltransferase Ste14
MDPMKYVGAAWLAFALYWLVQGARAKKAQRREPPGERLAHVMLMTAAFYLVFIHKPRLGPLNEPLLPREPWLRALGVALTFVGVGFAIWARHHIGRYWSGRVSIVSEHKLIRTGPYARIRHPIYAGMLLALVGTVLVENEYRALLGLALALTGFTVKAIKEETFLKAQFGEAFEEHRRLTGFFLPKIP